MLARAVALGRSAWIPAALILVNLVAVGAGTFCIATLLARSGLPPALAAFYFLFPGLLTAFAEDLSEPLAYGLAALGLLLLAGWRSPGRVAGAAALFALAALTRETTLLIPATAAVIHVATSPREPGRLRRAIAAAGSSHPGSAIPFAEPRSAPNLVPSQSAEPESRAFSSCAAGWRVRTRFAP